MQQKNQITERTRSNSAGNNMEELLVNNDDNDNYENHLSQQMSPRSKQKLLLDLNDPNIRLPLWSILYLVISVAEINFTVALRIYYNSYKEAFDDHGIPDPYSDTTGYDFLRIIANILLLLSSLLVLLGLRATSSQKSVISALFIIGALFHVIYMIWGIAIYCVDDPLLPSINNDNNWCRLSFIGSDLYLILFTFFYAFDILYNICNSIRVRVFIISFILCANSWINTTNSYHDDDSYKNNKGLIYVSTIVATGYIFVAIVCLIIVSMYCLVVFGFVILWSGADGYKCDPSQIVRKGFGVLLLSALGLIFTQPYIFIFVTGSVDEIGTPSIHSLFYYIAGLVLFVYDLQYVK